LFSQCVRGKRAAPASPNQPARHERTGTGCRAKPAEGREWPSKRWPGFCDGSVMQAPATPSAPTALASPPHVRIGRSSPVAPQPAAAPEGFGHTLAHALLTPGDTSPAQPGAGERGPATLLPTGLPAPAQVVPPAVPIRGAAKGVNVTLKASTTELQPGKQPAIADDVSESARPPWQPSLQQTTPVPVTAEPIPSPTPPVGPAYVAPITNPADAEPDAIEATPFQPDEGQAAASVQAPGLHSLAPAGAAGLTVHAGADRPLVPDAHEAAAATPDVALEALPVVGPALLVSAPSAPPASALYVAAAPSLVSRPHPTAGPSPQSPAGQVAPALATFVASAAQPGAAQHLTIRLDPAELGRVQVHIERAPGGAARVELVVERPDTLLLLRDQPQLHRALDLAGVPIADRTLQFHLAPSATANLGTATPQSNADAGSGQQRPGQLQHRGSNNGSASSPDNSTLQSILPPAAAFRRAGVDIMA